MLHRNVLKWFLNNTNLLKTHQSVKKVKDYLCIYNERSKNYDQAEYGSLSVLTFPLDT